MLESSGLSEKEDIDPCEVIREHIGSIVDVLKMDLITCANASWSKRLITEGTKNTILDNPDTQSAASQLATAVKTNINSYVNDSAKKAALATFIAILGRQHIHIAENMRKWLKRNNIGIDVYYSDSVNKETGIVHASAPAKGSDVYTPTPLLSFPYQIDDKTESNYDSRSAVMAASDLPTHFHQQRRSLVFNQRRSIYKINDYSQELMAHEAHFEFMQHQRSAKFDDLKEQMKSIEITSRLNEEKLTHLKEDFHLKTDDQRKFFKQELQELKQEVKEQMKSIEITSRLSKEKHSENLKEDFRLKTDDQRKFFKEELQELKQEVKVLKNEQNKLHQEIVSTQYALAALTVVTVVFMVYYVFKKYN